MPCFLFRCMLCLYHLLFLKLVESLELGTLRQTGVCACTDMANCHCTGGRALLFGLAVYWTAGNLLLLSIVPLSATLMVHPLMMFEFWAPEEALTVFVYCIISATISMSGLSSQVVMLINISLLSPQQEPWYMFSNIYIWMKPIIFVNSHTLLKTFTQTLALFLICFSALGEADWEAAALLSNYNLPFCNLPPARRLACVICKMW